jgi:hypothetical protein
MLYRGLEFVLLFAGTMVARQLVGGTGSASYPNLLWLPVVVLTLQHGLASGLAAALIATALQFSGGLPAALITEDLYAYIARIAAEPIGWTCVALLIGQLRSRQIAQNAELQARLDETGERCAALADLSTQLRSRAEMLERQIAADVHASNLDVVQALSKLQESDLDQFQRCLTKFMLLMTGCPEFTVFLRGNDAFTPAIRAIDDRRPRAEEAVPRDHPLLAEIADGRRMLSAARPADAAVLGGHGVMAGPLIDSRTDQVVGMLVLAGASIEDLPRDIAERFCLICSELSRLAGRMMLLDRWQGAAAESSNGRKRRPDGAAESAVRKEELHTLPRPGQIRRLTLQ